MTTITHSSGNSAQARAMHSGPYAGPNHRRSDDVRSLDAAIARVGSAALGPYLPGVERSALERAGIALASTSASIAVAAAGVAFLHDSAEIDSILIDSTEPPHAAPFGREQASVSRVSPDSFDAARSDTVTPAASGAELPWITTFLDDVSPISTAESAKETLAPVDWFNAEAPAELPVSAEAMVGGLGAINAAAVEDVAVGHIETNDDAAVNAELGAAWDADGVGEEMRALADAFGTHIAPVADVVDASTWHRSQSAADVADAEPLPMWTDDDFPAEIASGVLDGVGDADADALAAAAIEAAAQMALAQESAAAALESLAQRVRSGDLEILGFRADQGDAAAVAAALAALLGAPRRG